jgi:hypothetical protein
MGNALLNHMKVCHEQTLGGLFVKHLRCYLSLPFGTQIEGGTHFPKERSSRFLARTMISQHEHDFCDITQCQKIFGTKSNSPMKKSETTWNNKLRSTNYQIHYAQQKENETV